VYTIVARNTKSPQTIAKLLAKLQSAAAGRAADEAASGQAGSG
jgi:hypothetical protein